MQRIAASYNDPIFDFAGDASLGLKKRVQRLVGRPWTADLRASLVSDHFGGLRIKFMKWIELKLFIDIYWPGGNPNSNRPVLIGGAYRLNIPVFHSTLQMLVFSEELVHRCFVSLLLLHIGWLNLACDGCICIYI